MTERTITTAPAQAAQPSKLLKNATPAQYDATIAYMLADLKRRGIKVRKAAK